MKRLLTVVITTMLFFSCKTEPQRTDYIINGSAKDVYNGVRAYLKTKDNNGREKILDTAIIFDEKFTFKGITEYPILSMISVNSVPGNLSFMLENSLINVNINKSNILASTVTGSSSQKDYESYQKGINDINKELTAVKIQLRNNAFQGVTLTDSLNQHLRRILKKQQDYPLEFIKNNTNSNYSLVLIDQGTNRNNTGIEDYMKAYEGLNSKIKATPTAVNIKKKLDGLFSVYQKSAQLQIGKVAPNFEAPTPDGKTVSLNEIKGKVTIVDFWAAWCGPCRRENPNVVRIYNQYHDQGLEIIGVSLDGQSRQNEPKNAWLQAIEKDKLTWTHVSHLQYFNDPVAKLYNITAIPATYILDKDGKIAAKNLRGKALELKVQELLSK